MLFIRRIVVVCVLLAGGADFCAASIRYVRASAPSNGDGLSWATAHRQLFDALDAAAGDPGIDQIWAAASTYSPKRSGSNRDQTFVLVSGVSVYGGFAGNETSLAQRNPAANVTILTGDFNNNDQPNFVNRGDNARHIVRGTALTSGRLDGFTIRGGNADFPGDDLLGGGALYLRRCTYEIANCTFTDNIAGGTAPDIGGFGGAVFLRACAHATVSDCRFQANRGMNGGALGVYYTDEDDVVYDTITDLVDCDFIANFSPSQTGGAMWTVAGDTLNQQAVGTITASGCLFEGNHAEYYGAWIDQNTTELVVEDCEFRQNSSVGFGAAMCANQTVGPTVEYVAIRRCLFEQNSSDDNNGAALMFQARRAKLDSCIVRNNTGITAVHASPLVGFQGGALTIEVHNSLIHDNSGVGLFGFRNPLLKVTGSTIYGNISAIPGGLAGGIETSAADVQIVNTILWANERNGVRDEDAQIRSFDVPADVTFSIVEGSAPSVIAAVLADDPKFVNEGAGDFRLSPGSPAIDAGNRFAVFADEADADGDGNVTEASPFDLDGNRRFRNDLGTPGTGLGSGPMVDIGPYEFQGETPPLQGVGERPRP